LSENIADLAGLSAAYDAWSTSLNGLPRRRKMGSRCEQQFFIAYAQTWQTKGRFPWKRSRLATDGHAPPHYRA